MKKYLLGLCTVFIVCGTLHAGWIGDVGAIPGDLKVGGQVIYQKDKYIVCDVFTSTGINACIALLNGPGEVKLLEGTYSVTTAIKILSSSQTLTGSGAGTILDASTLQPTPAVIDTNGMNNVIIRNLMIIGSAGSGSSGELISDTGGTSDNLLLENLWLIDSDDSAVFTLGVYVEIKNVHVDNPDGRGLETNGHYGYIHGCSVLNAGSLGIRLSGQNGRVIGNYIFNSGGHAINIVGSSQVIGNTINTTGTSLANGIDMVGGDNIASGNTIKNVGNNQADIRVIGSDRAIIVGNTLNGSGLAEYGILLNESDYCIVTGNYSEAHDTAGIQEDNDCQNNVIYGNNLQDSTKSIINGTLHEKLDLPISLADGTGLYVLRAKAGWGHIYASDDVSYAYFTFTSAGVVTLVSQNNCTTTQNNDGTLNIYDSGSEVTIENELGATKKFRIDINYID